MHRPVRRVASWSGPLGVLVALSLMTGACRADSSAPVAADATGGPPTTTSAGGVGASTAAASPTDSIGVDVGWSLYETSDDTAISWAALFENPRHEVATEVSLVLSFLDDRGHAVWTETEWIPLLMPGGSAWAKRQVPGSLDNGGMTTWAQAVGVVDVTAEVAVGAWVESPPDVGRFDVSDVDLTLNEFFPAEVVHASVSSTFRTEQRDNPAVAVFRDSNGAVIGGARWQVDAVPGGGSVGVTIESRENLEGVARADVFVVPGSLS